MFPKVWDAHRLEVWGDDHELYAVEIQNLAIALSRKETLDYYNLEEDELPEYDHFFFDANYKRGLALAKQNATSKLFENMGGNYNAAMEYMKRFGSDKWQVDTGSGNTIGEIKVTLDGA
ncbi:MAG: hypothetical protein R3250_00115 [Melioribacteraceae bacterium]|nr:hypothetical protein [Melioribacteraceae bacterium]